MTREEWLNGIHSRLRANQSRLRYLSAWNDRPPTFLPSFPSRNTRTVQVGDLALQNDGRVLGLVSPLLSDSTEVALVVYWLAIRHDYRMYDRARLTTARNQRTLSRAGFNSPFKSCVPTEATINTVAEIVTGYINEYGEYPAEFVDLTPRRTQTTRLLKVSCNNSHNDGQGEYILRMSAFQYERNAPLCGVCQSYMEVSV